MADRTRLIIQTLNFVNARNTKLNAFESRIFWQACGLFIPTLEIFELIALELNKLWELKVTALNNKSWPSVQQTNELKMAYNTRTVLSKTSPFRNKASILRQWVHLAVDCVVIDEPIIDDWELRKGIAQLLSIPNGR